MIELKFRAWNKAFNRMTYKVNLYSINKIGKINKAQLGDENVMRTIGLDCEVMQFTGLKDKNGKEIYEGDIFRQEIELDERDLRTYQVVIWIKERAAFYLVPCGCHEILINNDCEKDETFEWLFEQAHLYDFSIDVGLPLVGNIYETPELLNKEP